MAVTPEQFLLNCLSDYIHNRITECADSKLRWDSVFKLASSHSVEGIVYYQCMSCMPKDIRKTYLKPYLGNAVISIKRSEIMKELSRHLEKEQIPAVWFKGAVLRNYYPVPQLRSMGDIDCVIRPADKNRVDEILRSRMNFQRFIDNHAVWTYWKDNIYLEVHNQMFYENLASKIDYISYFDNVWSNASRGTVFDVESPLTFVPDENFHFLYLMTHHAKHVINNGIGFRAYLDMVLMTQRCGDKLNWEFIESELDKLGLLTFTKICFSCCERWFSVKMPLGQENFDEDLFSEITEKTFRDGTFGLDNTDNQRALIAKDILYSSDPYLLAAVKRGFRRLFPPYKELQLIPWYSFIDGRPWLLPAAWIYRFGYVISRKIGEGKDYLLDPFVKKKEVLERQELIRKWGL